MTKKSGVLMHISSLPGEFGCGNFGKNAFEFIDLIKECGFSYWQVLPFGLTDSHFSPYMSYSSFGGNPYFIDPETLYEEKLITKSELEDAKCEYEYLCDYKSLEEKRFSLLKKASERFKENDKISDFLKENPIIDDFCVFMSKKMSNAGKCHTDWTNTEYSGEDLEAWRFIEYEFFSQWEKVHSYAKKRGISILGDLPFYVSFDSQDVWQFSENFMLDESGRMKKVAGVPPDYFTMEGQKWGNPLYDWEKMKKDGYSYWKLRFKKTLELYDGLRIDHFRALSEFWAVPEKDKTAKNGEWIKAPGKEITDFINSVKGEKLIIAENLGMIDEKVNKLVEYSGFEKMSVFQFGFDGNRDNPHLPHNYTNNTVCYTGTHDNNTLLGFMWELDEKTRNDVLDYIGFSGNDWNKSYDLVMRMMLQSAAELVIFPIQDVLGYGADTRLNTPGKADGNWRFRVTKEQLDSIDRERFSHINYIYSRI